MANVNVNQNLDNSNVVEIEPTKVNQPWPTKNETIFSELMDKQVALKNRPNTTFTRESWNYILQELKQMTGYAYTHEQLKNKFNALRQVWKDFHKLVTNTTGAGWDPEKGTVTFPNDVWDNLIKVNKRAKKLRKKGYPHYEALCRIYPDTTATDKHSHPSTKPPSDNEKERDPNYDPKDEEANDNDDDNPVDTKHNRSQSTTPTSSRQPKRETYGRALTNALTVLVDSAKLRASYYEKKLASGGESLTCVESLGDSVSTDNPHKEMLKACMTALNSLEDIDDVAYTKAVKLLRDVVCRELFLSMPERRRRGVVLNL